MTNLNNSEIQAVNGGLLGTLAFIAGCYAVGYYVGQK